MPKKVCKQKYFSVITKNSNWKIVTKNLVTFKRWDEVKDEVGGRRWGGGVSKKEQSGIFEGVGLIPWFTPW